MRQLPVFCSVATRSHLTQALTCLRSLQEHQPQAALALLAIDMGDAAPPSDMPNLHCLTLETCVPADTLRRMRETYSTAELCFAAKPFLIARLLERGADQLHYLDGDCLAFASLEALVEDLAQADLLLTPHSLTPIPDDGRTPGALTLLRAGVFNAGYLGVRNTTQGRHFAHWLSTMTAEHAKNEPDRGMCGDQRWLDLVPVLFPGAAICRRQGADMAYWNLHERKLAGDARCGFTVNGEPLLFFHFSGWRAEHPWELSIHQDRHAAPQGSALFELLGEYRRRLPPAAPPPARWRRMLRLRA